MKLWLKNFRIHLTKGKYVLSANSKEEQFIQLMQVSYGIQMVVRCPLVELLIKLYDTGV